MALDCIVKAGSISNLNEARYCAGMGVDFLGFNCDPGQPGYTDPVFYREITSWISGVKFTAEFRTHDAAIILHSLEHFRVDLIEIRHPQLLVDLENSGLPMMLRLPWDDQSDMSLSGLLERWPDNLEYLILEFRHMPPEIPPDRVRALVDDGAQILIAADFRADQVRPFLERWSPAGLALPGGDDIRPGELDFFPFAEILEILECD